MGSLESNRSILTQSRADQVIERWRVGDTRGEVLDVPEISESLEDGGSTVGSGLARDGIRSVLLDVSLLTVRGDNPGRHAATQTVEVKSVFLTVLRSLSVGQVVRADGERGRDMVVEATGLVVGNEEQGLVPLRALANGIIDLLDEDLTVGDVTGGVHGVGVGAAAGGVNVREFREDTEVGVLEEVFNGHHVGPGGLVDVGEEERIRFEFSVGAIVVEPGHALLVGGLEDGLARDTIVQEVIVILAMPSSGSCQSAQAVGVGRLLNALVKIKNIQIYRTYARNTREPAVESSELIHKVHERRNLLLRIVSHHLPCRLFWGQFGVVVKLCVEEARLVGDDLATGNRTIVWGVSSVELQVITSHGVVWIVEHGIIVLGLSTVLARGWVARILVVAERAVVDRVVQSLAAHASQNVIEGSGPYVSARLHIPQAELRNLLFHI